MCRYINILYYSHVLGRHCKSLRPAGTTAISAFVIRIAPTTTRPELILWYSRSRGFCDFLLYCVSSKLYRRHVLNGRENASFDTYRYWYVGSTLRYWYLSPTLIFEGNGRWCAASSSVLMSTQNCSVVNRQVLSRFPEGEKMERGRRRSIRQRAQKNTYRKIIWKMLT